ncbi:hypothetical protein BU24DRAFT_46890 [Aaosphaeria arxii CBS 175.79]|uniref:Rhodopsin domain-containing protein n=1 Tax=Aaosphaeria arxii CBS 175.79 TaxID=1450172 RepID=A0A6A5XDG0_9PLEO|nr:uncharacterized protein BU24DRAFT_46890 [Aaosphaeria arxii CBS 175.79]KAF2010837.1 hypothetical protein BU24DRAFT_46890 [Aaosphaeria arxii CBS 175.79]
MEVLSAANVAHLTKSYRTRTIATISVCFPVAVLAVILRFTARRVARTKIWYDDWLSCAGLVLLGVFISLILVDLPDDSIIQGDPILPSLLSAHAKTVYIAELLYYVTQLSLKASILAYYWRLFSMSSMRVPIYFVTCFVVGWFIASILVAAFQCIPVASLWTPALKSSAKCIQLRPFFFGVSIPNILADLFLLALPLPYVWSLKISITQRVFVIGFFLLGGFVLIASALRLPFVLRLDPNKFAANWSVDDSVLWSAIENCMGVVCVCLPSLRPVVRLFPCASSSDYPSAPDVRYPGSEQGANKKEQQHELAGWERGRGRVMVGGPTGWPSLQSMEEGSSTDQTKIPASSGNVKQPEGTV